MQPHRVGAVEHFVQRRPGLPRHRLQDPRLHLLQVLKPNAETDVGHEGIRVDLLQWWAGGAAAEEGHSEGR